MEAIPAVARRHHLKVGEDCAQGPGGKYRGHYVGTIGDAGCFSISCCKLIGAFCRGRRHGPDWHFHACMLPVILQQGRTPGGSVFEDPRYLARGACPVADELWARGVYFWIDPWRTPADGDAVAAGINKVLAACCAEAPTP